MVRQHFNVLILPAYAHYSCRSTSVSYMLLDLVVTQIYYM